MTAKRAMAKPPRSQDPGAAAPGFEEQMARLEALLAELEGGKLSLEQGVERFQEGVVLLGALNRSLGAAERRVEELTASLRRELEELERAREDDDAA